MRGPDSVSSRATHARARRSRAVRRPALLGLSASLVALTAFGVSGAAASRSTAAVSPRAQSAKAQFQALVAAARASNHVVLQPLQPQTPQQITTWEQGFEQEFGFPVNLQNVPGNPSLQVPSKVLSASPSNTGVDDILVSLSVSNALPLFDANDLTEPNWTALEYKWPVLATLRNDYVPHISKPNNGPALTQYCALLANSPFVIAYNTAHVTKAELRNFTWLDLTKPQWRGRVGVDNSGDTNARLSLIKGFSVNDAIKFARALAQNGAVPLTGTAAIVSALESGQIWIAPAAINPVTTAIDSGAPIGYIYAPLSSTAHALWEQTTAACIARPTASNLAMVELWYGYMLTQGTYALVPSGGNERDDPAEAKYFPQARQIAKAGFTPSQVVTFKTVTQTNNIVPLENEVASILAGG